ncbi:MAG: NADH-quinone oxidoreductase subunit NuoF [candidate division KSB1 bacterium]|nr:NADH-quinone oxidoreductase subunit NuoF [candidate division KSB1 bacterium]
MGNAQKFYRALEQYMEEQRDQSGIDDKILIQVGSATCENAAGSEAVWKELDKLIRVSGREDIILKQTGCTGRCAREPIVGVFVPGQIPIKYETVDPDKVHRIFSKHVMGGETIPGLILDKETEQRYSHVITVCNSSRCNGSGKDPAEEIRAALKEANIEDNVRIFKGGCFGLCSDAQVGKRGVMMIFPARVLYAYKNKEELKQILDTHINQGKLAESFKTQTDFITEQFFSRYGDVAFFNKQTRLTLRNSGLIDPESLQDYVHHKGFAALAKALDQGSPKSIVDEIAKSGLRGRGGGGYPTGTKWKFGAQAKDTEKYVVCNADEGDPGAFMDRSALEGDPFIIIEGMTIGGLAIGAQKGYIYVRAEYPLAIERLQNAIQVARDNKLLGKNIMNSGFNFDIEIRLGAGAFVCGEETALMLSVEGKRGQPRIRPPYPTDYGLWGHPTVINNVETWANIPTIMLYGADWFSHIGTKTSRGTKVFALAGKVSNTGLVEVPMGTTLREIIYDIGGGIPDGKTLKAVQTGGPSGGCIPASQIDTPVDYDRLAELGSIMGSGGMIILDEDDCMVATAKFFLEFTKSESCGKCVPCREGTVRMLEILECITQGDGKPDDLVKLERLGKLIQSTSLCGLGTTAPNPVLSALENFREEFELHANEKTCPAHSCRQLIRYEINPDKCTGCTLCARRCPVSCISGERKKVHVIDQEACIKCGECYNVCKFDAVDRL